MTGFELHHPPGFVDRAYLVFLLLSRLIELPVHFGSGRAHPPFAFELGAPAGWPGYEPRGASAPCEDRVDHDPLGEKLGW